MSKKRSDYSMDDKEPLTPVGSYFARPEMSHVILCGMGFANPTDIDAIIDDITKFVLVKVPRFSALLMYDPFDGSHYWKQTHVRMDDHVIIHNDDDGHDTMLMSYDDIINSYMSSDVIMSPFSSMDKPLWELHIIPKHKFMVIKVHHALGDGISLMSMLWSMGRPNQGLLSNDHNYGLANNVNNNKTMSKKSDHNYKSIFNVIFDFIKYIWYFFIFAFKYIARCLWEKDEIPKRINGSIQVVDVVKPKMATATFSLDDMKGIKKAIPNATVHDVLYGIIWCGLTKYVRVRCPQALEHGAQITGMCPSNLRKEPGLQDLSKMLCESSKPSWGNKFGMILTPIFYYNGKQCDLEPLMYVKKAKSFMDRKKQYSEALVSYQIGCILSTLFGSNKITSLFFSKLLSNSTFLLSNIAGPPEEISIGGNPVTLIRITVYCPQPQEITMHMVSYNGRADLQVQVANNGHVFTDPKFLAKCFEDSMLKMKSASDQIILSNGLTK